MNHMNNHNIILMTEQDFTVKFSIKGTSLNKSPAVARVSRPYSWCTLATCIHNCPSMMFWTCCCLRPKCKRSYCLFT